MGLRRAEGRPARRSKPVGPWHVKPRRAEVDAPETLARFRELVEAGTEPRAVVRELKAVGGDLKALRLALKDAGLNPGDIGYINAHGTSTPLGDKAETQAIKRVFGEHAKKASISSTKSQLGHSLGASGGIELVVTVKALVHGAIPPTINLTNPDPGCDLDPLGAFDAARRPGAGGNLQQAIHHARRHDDFLLLDPVDPGGLGKFSDSFDDRRPRPRFPTP